MNKCDFRSIQESSGEFIPKYFATCALIEDSDGDTNAVIDAGESKKDFALAVCRQCQVNTLKNANLLPLEVQIFEGYVMVKWYDLLNGKILSHEETALMEGK